MIPLIAGIREDGIEIGVAIHKSQRHTLRIIERAADWATGKAASAVTEADEPLFKLAIVPIEPSADPDNETPLQSMMTLPRFALVVSMNHTAGDGHTYYKLYGMLDADVEVGAIDPVRVADFEAAKTEVIGENENAMFTSAGDQGPVQAVERDYPFSMRSRISAWLMESSPSRSRVSPSA